MAITPTPIRYGRLTRVGDGKFSFIPNDGDHNGWLLLGTVSRLISRVQYANLFQVIGTKYSAGDGSTTFGLPPVGDTFPMFAGTKYQFGSKGGSETVTLTVAQIPSHTHTEVKSSVAATPSQNALLTGVGLSPITKPPTTTVTSGEVAATGGNGAHDNMPPFTVINAFIYAGMPVT